MCDKQEPPTHDQKPSNSTHDSKNSATKTGPGKSSSPTTSKTRKSAPQTTQTEAGASINPTYHGTNGPVHVGLFNLRKRENDLTGAVNRTLGDMGVLWNPDLNSRRTRRYTIHPSTVDEGVFGVMRLVLITGRMWIGRICV